MLGAQLDVAKDVPQNEAEVRRCRVWNIQKAAVLSERKNQFHDGERGRDEQHTCDSQAHAKDTCGYDQSQGAEKSNKKFQGAGEKDDDSECI